MPFPYVLPLTETTATVDPTADAYARQLKQLLPPGSLWNLMPGSWISKVFLGMAEELTRIDARGKDLIEESDPRTATETLDCWESMLGLPDSAVTSIPSTTAGRRLAITQKLTQIGGQNAAYFIGLAAAAGYTATVTDTLGSLVLRSGFRSGDRCYGIAWAWAWQLNVSAPSGTALTHAELEAIINRAKPAHTVVIFNYL